MFYYYLLVLLFMFYYYLLVLLFMFYYYLLVLLDFFKNIFSYKLSNDGY